MDYVGYPIIKTAFIRLKKLWSLSWDIFLDSCNPIGYSMAHDQIFYP